MAMVTFCNTDHQLSQSMSYENNSGNNLRLRDASFSSYLNNTEDCFVLKIAESSQNLKATASNAEDGEIGVFDAEKYFNGGMDEEKPKIIGKVVTKNRKQEDKPLYVDPIKPNIQAGTPSVRSETSWNSQNALLQSVFRHSSRRDAKKVQGKSFLASFGCKCSCYDKSSVEIDENERCGEVHAKNSIETSLNPPDVAQISSKPRENNRSKRFHKMGIEPNREMHSTLPDPVPGIENIPKKLQFQEEESQNGNEKARQSIEVFGSPVMDERNKSLSLDRRPLTVLTWDESIPIAQEIEIPSASCGVYTDTESDASSDLFEIESLTSKPNHYPLRQPSDGLSGCVTPTSCYTPSEASIEWSVITASVADFSVMSDSEEIRPTKFTANNSIKKVSTPPRRISSSLLGCKSQKAITVAADAYIRNESKTILKPRMQHKPELFAPTSRFQSGAKLMAYDSRSRQPHSFTNHAPSRSPSSQGSHLLYIQ